MQGGSLCSGSSRQNRGAPGNLKIVPAAGAVGVQRLAGKERPRTLARLHRPRIDFVQDTANIRRLMDGGKDAAVLFNGAGQIMLGKESDNRNRPKGMQRVSQETAATAIRPHGRTALRL